MTHVFDLAVLHTLFIPCDEGLVESENCNSDYGLLSTSPIQEDVYDNGVFPFVNLPSMLPLMYKTGVDERLFFGMDYFVTVYIGHGNTKRGLGFSDSK